MFGWEYPPRHLGGLGVACQGLVRGLLQHNIRVTLVLPFAGDQDVDGLEIRFPTQKLVDTIRVKSLLLPYDSPEVYAQRIQHIPRETSHI